MLDSSGSYCLSKEFCLPIVEVIKGYTGPFTIGRNTFQDSQCYYSALAPVTQLYGSFNSSGSIGVQHPLELFVLERAFTIHWLMFTALLLANVNCSGKIFAI